VRNPGEETGLRCCPKHPDQLAASDCRRCGLSWCTACLLHPFGAERPALCVSCALVVSGVKVRGVPAMTRKDRRALRRAMAADRAAESAPALIPTPPPPPEPANDWSIPWWEAEPTRPLTQVD
jgi:hypothetical protein